MLRKIEVKNGRAIWKSSDNHTGAINFYGVRPVDANDKPFDDRFPMLWQARESLETA